MVAAVSYPIAQPLTVRPVDESEHAFVLDSWVKSYQSLMPPYAKTYGLGRWGWVTECARHGLRTGLTLVATQEDYPDVVLGWACGEPQAGVLHYCYVKSAARRRGISGALLSQLGFHVQPGLGRRTTRVTHRPGSALRAHCAALGMRWAPLTDQEIA